MKLSETKFSSYLRTIYNR